MPAIADGPNDSATAGVFIFDGCVVRAMSVHERNAWEWLLYMGSQYGASHVDDFQDRVCAAANRSESQSLNYERRGMHADAAATQLTAALFDHAAQGFVVDALTGRKGGK